MLRLVGALLLAGGTGVLGFSAAARLGRRADVLRALLGALEEMDRELAFRLTPLPELFARLAEDYPPPVGQLFAFLKDGLKQLGEKSFAQIWREALARTPLDLGRRAGTVLEELGTVLGGYDAAGQRAALARARDELDRELADAREDREKRGRMYQVLGVTAGAFLVILLL